MQDTYIPVYYNNCSSQSYPLIYSTNNPYNDPTFYTTTVNEPSTDTTVTYNDPTIYNTTVNEPSTDTSVPLNDDINNKVIANDRAGKIGTMMLIFSFITLCGILIFSGLYKNPK